MSAGSAAACHRASQGGLVPCAGPKSFPACFLLSKITPHYENSISGSTLDSSLVFVPGPISLAALAAQQQLPLPWLQQDPPWSPV